ncbi:MAG: tRNA (adenosine(37)-N6)-threonylcarbamoyltransferase complex transferase subunit TsaD [Bacteroidetes bacterium]|nr:tRNA (adenosine(37)-N6)-threonylcarbamoyltransferase complex transferase subunit TsaD [Bacteroidota bacterium]
MDVFILGIESSCDDTSAAILKNDKVLSNVISSQVIHEKFGGVVPELASRAHQQNIVPVIEQAFRVANIDKKQLQAIAFTQGPGLMGSLLVGVSFAKAFALARNIPLLETDHLQAHILAHFIDEGQEKPAFPFLCLLVSGGHTQLVLVRDHFDMEIMGQTLDDAAGECFDKAAKTMGLPYPGGPVIDQLAKEGNPKAFSFAEPQIPGLDYSFSGLKTSFLYFLRDALKEDPAFIQHHVNDLCASLQHTIVKVLMEKVIVACKQTGITRVAIAGGVSANSALRNELEIVRKELQWKVFLPRLAYSTDNAAMIGIAGYFKYLKKDFASQGSAPFARAKASFQ